MEQEEQNLSSHGSNISDWQGLSSELQAVVRRLSSSESSIAHLSLPRKSLAGVLVLLCRDETNSVSVILTTRALTMRSYPGETALPGGRMEEDDRGIAETALREAKEEIGLSLPESDLKVKSTLKPFLSKNLLFVVPVIAVTRHTVNDLLTTFTANVAEVGSIWSWPLKDFLGLQEPSRPQTSVVRYDYRDVKWIDGVKYRLHEFHHDSMGSPVTGLTAEILLSTALLAYAVEKPGFESKALGQLSSEEMVQAVLDGRAGINGDERSSIRKQRVTEDTVAGALSL